MSGRKQCNCMNSKLSPHRRDKCMLRVGQKRKKVGSSTEIGQSSSSLPVTNDNSGPIPVVIVHNEIEIMGEDVTFGNEVIAEEASSRDGEAVSIGENNITLTSDRIQHDGDAQCDCSTYFMSPHRKKVCNLNSLLGRLPMRKGKDTIQVAAPLLEPVTNSSQIVPISSLYISKSSSMKHV